jgi:hypothetical protein
MERRHIIKLVPARVPAGIVPHAVTAPAMINGKFIDVIAAVTDALFLEDLLDKVDHVSGVVRPVIAPVNEKDIEFFPIKSQFLFVPGFFEFAVRAGALRAFFRRAVTSVGVPAHVAFPGVTWQRAGWFLIP